MAFKDTITQNEEEWNEDNNPEVNREFNAANPELLERLKKENQAEKKDIYQLLMPRLDDFINTNLISNDYYICKDDCDAPLYLCGLSYMEYATEETDFQSRLELGFAIPINDEPPYKIERNWVLRFDYEGWVYFELTCGCIWNEDFVSTPANPQNPEDMLISIHRPFNDQVWYSDVVFKSDNKPEKLPCSKNQRQFFRNRIFFEEVYKNFRTDTTETNKKKWHIKEAEEFDKKNNEENKDDLEDDENEDLDQRDIMHLAEEMIQDSINWHWWNSEYSICFNDCIRYDCWYTFAVTFVKDPEITYRYRARSAEIDSDGEEPYQAIVKSDLVVTYEALVYFWVGCFCYEDEFISSLPQPMSFDRDFWDPFDLTGEKSGNHSIQEKRPSRGGYPPQGVS